MADEVDVSPEEKLLKVIQSGDGDGTAAAPSGVVGGAATVAAEPPIAFADPSASAPTGSGIIGASGPDVASRRSGVRSSGFPLVRRSLAFAIFVFVVLACFELVTNVMAVQKRIRAAETSVAASAESSGAGVDLPAEPQDDPAVSEGDLADLAATLQRYAQFPLLQQAKPVVQGPEGDKEEATSLGAYIRENLNLIGLSGEEAILVDRKDRRMYFLSTGDTFTHKDHKAQSFELKRVQSDQVVFESPLEKVIVK